MKMSTKHIYLITVVLIIIISGVAFLLINNYSEPESNEIIIPPGEQIPSQEKEIPKPECENAQDGTSCTVGVWYDEQGRVCGGQSCVGLGLGKCYKSECVYLDEYENLLKNPHTECLGSCKCMKECNFQLEFFIPTEEGSSECSDNSINKICCCSGV